MKKVFKKLALICFVFIAVVGSAYALPRYTNKFYINDFANVLSADTENYVFSNSKLLEEKTGAQIVVATVNSLEGESLEQYSINLARSWEIGQKDKNNGLLILLAPNERKVRIEVGYGLEGALNDSKVGRLRDKFAIPHFKNDEWDEGIKELYMSLLSEVYKEYNMDIPEDVPEEIANYDAEQDDIGGFIALGFLTFFLIVSYIVYRKNIGKNNNNRRPPFTPFYGGGFGGSGGNFGSSSGSFGGGGGSFGGGGASGSF